MITSERTCVGCQRRTDRTRLLRFTADNRGHLKLDALQRQVGRGVYVCATLPCLITASRSAGFSRSLKRGVSIVEVDRLALRVREEVLAQAHHLRERVLMDGRGRIRDGRVEIIEKKVQVQIALLEEQARFLERGYEQGEGGAGECASDK